MSRRAAPPWIRLWAWDGLTVASSQFAALAVTTVLAVIVARYLGPSDFGIFAGFLAVSQVLMLFAGFGVSTWLLRELSNDLAAPDPDGATPVGRWISAGIGIAAGLSLTFTLAGVALASAAGSGAELTLALCALMAYTGLLGVATLLEVVFRAHRRLSRVVIATLLEKLSLTALVVLAVTSGAGMAGLAVAYTAAGVVRVGWSLIAIRSFQAGRPARPRRGDAITVISRSIPFGLGTALPTAVVRLDVFVIGLFSASMAGMYAIADRFLGVLLVIPAAFASALYPHLARRADPLGASWRAAAALGAVGAALAAVGIVLAEPAVDLLFGDEYAEAATAVRIMLLAAPLMFAASVLMTGMFSAGHERKVLVVMLACVIAGTGFVLLGREWFGLEGATAGYVARNAVLLVALAVLSLSLRRAPSPPAAGEEALPAGVDPSAMRSFPQLQGQV